MTQYRKKPVVIDAVQWWPDQSLGLFGPDGDYLNRRVGVDAHGVEYTICDCVLPTLEGNMNMTPGAWIITGVKGERYACRPDIFDATSEEV